LTFKTTKLRYFPGRRYRERQVKRVANGSRFNTRSEEQEYNDQIILSFLVIIDRKDNFIIQEVFGLGFLLKAFLITCVN
jgi:hypothetical protein